LHERRLTRFALKLPALKRAGNIACYLATTNEAPTQSLLHALHQRGKRVYVPVVRGQAMHFVRWQPHSALRIGRWGIREPRRHHGRIKPSQLQLVFAPLLGFDKKGSRLGMGGGYYDRTFAFKQKGCKKPLLAGFAYSIQEQAHLPVQAWDVALDCLITDKRCYVLLPGKLKNR
jgi:5-formyltetrahydrofolate cyclo-ligase